MFADEDRFALTVRRDALAAQKRRSDRDTEQLRIGRLRRISADGLSGTAELNVEEFVKRPLLHILARQMNGEVGWTPHRDDGEGLAAGQVDALDAQHLVSLQELTDSRRRLLECELDHLAFADLSNTLDLRLDGSE